MHISTGLFGLLLTLKRGVYYHSGLFLNCGGEPHPLASKKIFCLLGIVLLVQWTFTRHPLDFLLSLNMLVLVCCPALLSNGHPWTFIWHPTLTEQVYPTVLSSSLAHVMPIRHLMDIPHPLTRLALLSCVHLDTHGKSIGHPTLATWPTLLYDQSILMGCLWNTLLSNGHLTDYTFISLLEYN